jgi:hypothetical protein
LKLLSLNSLKIGLFLSSFQLVQAEISIQPINLERVVIQGNSKRVPLKIKKLPQVKIKNKNKLQQFKTPKTKNLEWNDSLNLFLGNFQFKKVENSFRMNHGPTGYGGYLSQHTTEGFRKGYGEDARNYRLEFTKEAPDNKYLFYIRSQYKKNNLELPEPEFLPYLGNTREEYGFKHNLTLKGKDNNLPFSVSFDVHSSKSSDNNKNSFKTALYRLGFIYQKNIWETAFSIENEKRGAQKLFLSKLFIKRTTRLLNQQTKLHVGLGSSLFFNRNANNSKLFSFNSKNKKRGVAFSPYAQLDHYYNKKTVLYLSFAQFYDKNDYQETNFNFPELNHENDIILPTLNTQIDGGIRYNINSSWKTLISASLHRFKNKNVLIEDLSTNKHHLKYESFLKGFKSSLNFNLISQLNKYFSMHSNVSLNRYRWENPSIKFNPYEGNIKTNFKLQFEIGKLNAKTEYIWISARKSYPIIQELSDKVLVNFSVKYDWLENLNFNLQLNNLFDKKYLHLPSYPASGINGMIGINLNL